MCQYGDLPEVMLLDQGTAYMLLLLFARWERIGPAAVSEGRDIFAEFLRQSDDERFSPFVQDLLGVMNAWKLSHPSAGGGHDD
jgi:hypothetical protein